MSSHKFPTPDKVYIKIINVFAKAGEDGCTHDFAWKTLFPNKPLCHDTDTFRGLLQDGLLEKLPKRQGRKFLYRTTKKGQDLLKIAMQFKDVCEFINLASECRILPEFKMQAVLHAHGEFLSKEFYEANIKTLAEGKTPQDITFASSSHCINRETLAKHIYNKFKKIPWFSEYCASVS